MKMHWSRWGYTTACGKHLSNSRWLTRGARPVTCRTCLKAIR